MIPAKYIYKYGETMQRQNEYILLSELIKRQGLLKKNNLFYFYQALFMTSLIIAGVLLTAYTVGNICLIIVASIFWAFFSGQIGLIGHDIVHRQVFKSPIMADVWGILTWNLLLGGSASWWREQHNNHHTHPNDHHQDPSINLSVFSFSREQFERKRKLQRFIIRYQAYTYFPSMIFMIISMRISSIRFILQKCHRFYKYELMAILIHILGYLSAILWMFDFWYGLIFMASHHVFMGLYLGFIFAPNHKGMPMIGSDSQLDYLRQQVITSRNVRGGFFTDLVYGGLNYQIEHHLFPFMPRNHLKKAKPIIEKFCLNHEIPYHETSIFQSYKEIILSLHKESISIA